MVNYTAINNQNSYNETTIFKINEFNSTEANKNLKENCLLHHNNKIELVFCVFFPNL